MLDVKRSVKTFFDLRKPRAVNQTNRAKNMIIREEMMREDQDWPSVWSVSKTFSPSTVPLPLRQSYEAKRTRVPRGKYANSELIKIPNFLHLGPVAIKRHCEAIKEFCTPWPEGLETDKEVRSHFPVTYVTRDYVHSSPSIRDPRARIVELKINIEDLRLKDLDKEKFILLSRHRYDPKSGILTITTDACPMKTQNKDYADYLLTALYFESIKHDDWEFESSRRIE